MAKAGKIRVGIGGWTFEPLRGTFYPKGLKSQNAHLILVSLDFLP